jgi:hypothetical protein
LRSATATTSSRSACSTTAPEFRKQELDRVFEPFYRLESSRNRATGGTGLGLSIARDVAQAHGGSLTLANREGGGLEARLVLPRLQSVTIAYGKARRARRRLILSVPLDAFVSITETAMKTRVALIAAAMLASAVALAGPHPAAIRAPTWTAWPRCSI